MSCAACTCYVPLAASAGKKLEELGLDARGECRRFPASVRKLPTEWCGEFKPKKGR